nr:MAG TPA: hypothetical protein [Caudoviricetes sp.]
MNSKVTFNPVLPVPEGRFNNSHSFTNPKN